MPASSLLFRLFVSSTFSDFVAERDALQRRVFPAMDALCRAYGARFRAVDLRWGVSEEASRDQQALDICLAEVARCQRTTPRPNFLILLGDRYGWRPLPSSIAERDFDALAAAVADPRDRDLLKASYARDENADPPVHLLRARSQHGGLTWDEVEQRVGAALRDAVARLQWPERSRRALLASATEHEIIAGALDPPGAPEHVLCVRRHIEGPPPDGAAAFFDQHHSVAARQQAATLRQELEDGLRRHLGPRFVELTTGWTADHPDERYLGDLPADPAARIALFAPARHSTLCEAVWGGLAPVLLERCSALAAGDDLARETAAHDAFCEDRVRVLIGRGGALDDLSDRVARGGRAPVVLVGERGAGKSSVIAGLAARLRTQYPPGTVVSRFIGVTARSVSGRALLADLCRAVARASGAATEAVDSDLPYDRLAAEFAERLAAVPGTRPVVLLLDALDQLAASDPARNLAWLPHALPPGARVVVSTATGELAELLARKLPPGSFLALRGLSAADSRTLVTRWLATAGRRVLGAQAAEVDRAAGRSGTPLHLRLIFEEVRRWRSFDGLPGGADSRPGVPGTVAGAVDDLLWRLSLESNHGPVLVPRAVAFLCAARHGLTDDEVVDLLSLDRELMDDFRRRSPQSPAIDRLPDIAWSRLYFDLEPYLTDREADGTMTLSFFHQQFAELAARRFLSGAQGAARHGHLADYFDAQPLEAVSGDHQSLNRRKLSELPRQLAASGRWDRLVAVLTDVDFLSAQVAAHGPNAVIEDLDSALASADRLPAGAPESLAHLRATMRLIAHVLARDPGQLRGQLHARIPRPAPPILEAMLDRAARRPGAWLHSVDASFWRAGGPVVSTIAAHRAAVNAIAITPNGTVAVSASSDGTLKVWDLARETERFVLAVGETPVLSVALTPDGSSIVGGAQDGTIGVWDLASGALRRRWQVAGPRRSLAVSADGTWLLSGTGQQELLILDLESGAVIRALALGDSGAAWLALSEDGRRLLTGGVYDHVTVMSLPDGRVSRTLYHGNDRWVSGVAMTCDGKTGVSGDWDGNLWVWDLDTGEKRLRLLGHRYNERITAVAVTPDGGRVVSASDRGRLQLYDIAGHACGDIDAAIGFGTGAHKITHIAITPDARRAITAGADATLRVWDLTSRESTGLAAEPDPFGDPGGDDDDDERPTFRLGGGQAQTVLATAQALPWSFDGRRFGERNPHDGQPPPAPARIVTALRPRDEEDAADSTRHCVSGEGLAEPLFLPQGPIEAAAVSRDGRVLACFGRDATLAMWDLGDRRRIASLPIPGRAEPGADVRVASAVVCRDATGAAAVTAGGVLHLWDLATGSVVTAAGQRVVAPLALTLDERAVAAFCADGWLRAWRVADGALITRSRVPRGSVTALASSGAYWLTPDGRLGRFDLARCARRRTLGGFGDAVAVSAGGTLAATRAEPGVTMWDLARGAPLVTVPAAGATGCALARWGRGGLLAVAGADLTLWDVATGRRLDVLTGDAPFATCVFDADGTGLTATVAGGGRHRFVVEGW